MIYQHESFREYMTRGIRESRRADLHMSGPHHHAVLGNHSLILMQSLLHRNMCELNDLDTYRFNSEIPDLKERALKHIPQSLRYACLQWATHFAAAKMHTPWMIQLMKGWVGSVAGLMSWLETLSVIGELPRAMPLLALAASWHKVRYHVWPLSLV